MKQKISDSNKQVSSGGRLQRYWAGRVTPRRRSGFANWDGKEIDAQDLAARYNIKGFEFGRYVNNGERNDYLIAAQESLKDLSDLLKTKNLGVEGVLGVAFGARGMGGRAAAHYEPGHNMINLTKNNGNHSLAHEYGHALDYNIGTYIDQNRNYRALSGGRSMAADLDDNAGSECRNLMRKLIAEIKATKSFGRLEDASAYWHYNTEVFARFFEQWCCYQLMKKNRKNTFLAKEWNIYTRLPQYLTESDFKKVLPTANKLMKAIGLTLNGIKK